MKTRLLIIIGIIAVIVTVVGVTVTSSFLFMVFDDGHYPETLALTWDDEKMIQDADVIVLGEFEKYENNQWVINTHNLVAKGNIKEPVIRVNSIFSEIILKDGTRIYPKIRESYVWFLTQDVDQYHVSLENGIVDSKYYHSILQAIIKPSIQSSIENKKVNLFDPTIPRTNEGRIDYHKLIEIVSKPVFIELFEKIGLAVQEDDLVLMRGPWISMYTEYSSMCGYALVDDDVYWLQSDLNRDTLTKAFISTQNPDPCKPSYGSCFCSAQYDMEEKTTTKLTYFDESQEEYVGRLLQNYLAIEKVSNVPEKFVVGNYNFEMKPNEITFCGAFVSERIKNPFSEMIIRENVTAHRYLSGVIKNDQVLNIGLEKPMVLCAINDNATIYPFEYVGEAENEN